MGYHSGCAFPRAGVTPPCSVNTTGVPTGDAPESMYMVVAGKHYNNQCCFDCEYSCSHRSSAPALLRLFLC